ncbi:MAG: methionine--tRNA ligase [Bacteroidota bacterium]
MKYEQMKQYRRYTVTAALPYANGPVHIGHLAGVYIPADIYSRYLKISGKDVFFVCGSDEHGVPITLKARKENILPQDVVDRYHAINKKAFSDFGIRFDEYGRTSSKTHHKVSSDFFSTLHKKGVFEEKTGMQYYDEEAKQFLADRYITGVCPHCGNENAYGDQCEKCGTSLSPSDLKNPRSAISGSLPVLKETKHWFLPLNKYSGFLENWILEGHKEWKPNVYGQCKSWIKDIGLEPRAVTRDLEWGVPVPVPEAAGKVLYVWFDAPIGYISNTVDWAERNGKDWKKYWQDEETKLVHFIGKDNIVFHCIVFPVMLKTHGQYILPENVPANEFLNLEGDKISTSRNWAVWLHEYLEEFPGMQDVLRYVLTANAPETKDNDFTWKDFQSRNNNELVAVYGNFINRTLVLTHKYFDGRVPENKTAGKREEQVISSIWTIKRNIEQNLENYKFREALKQFMDLARIGNLYLSGTEPWKLIRTDPEKTGTILATCLEIAGALACLSGPFLPFSSARLKTMLDIESCKWNEIGNQTLFKRGHQIGEAELLFNKIEDEAIEKQIEKLNRTKIENMVSSDIKPQKDIIQYDDFIRNDIRTGTVLEAEMVPKTQKLMKLLVDTGIDKRTVVSGIAEYYKPEEVIGRQVCILVNLEPRKLRGIESQGMILMAEDKDGRLVFVSPSEKISEGGEVK